MTFIQPIVSGLVHIYTIGYMHGESGYPRFFAYIALFVGIIYADFIDPYMRGTFNWLLAHPGITSICAFSPLAASLLGRNTASRDRQTPRIGAASV